MIIIIVIQLVFFFIAFSKIRGLAKVFPVISGSLKKVYNDDENRYELAAESQMPIVKKTIAQLNKIIQSQHKENEFHSSTLTVEDVFGSLYLSLKTKVSAWIGLHLVVAFSSIIIVFLQLAFREMGTDFFVNTQLADDASLSFLNVLSGFNVFYFFVLLIALVLMSIEYCYWMFKQHQIQEEKTISVAQIDEMFKGKGLGNLKSVLYNFTTSLNDITESLNNTNHQLNLNLNNFNTVIKEQKDVMDNYGLYLNKLQGLKLENVVIDIVELNDRMQSSLKIASEQFPLFGSLSKSLNDLLNRSVMLYGELNKAIDRDAQFGVGIKVFNDTVQHNGHITASLLETMNKVQTHINQVLLVHGPKIQDLDEEFFKYLEKRLSSFKTALQKNDELILSELNKISKQKT